VRHRLLGDRLRHGVVPRRGRGERGATLVEAVLVLPLFFTLVFGVMEAGYAWFGRSTVNNMSVVGARSGSGEANEVLADYAILQSVRDGAAGIGTARIQFVVVYRAVGPSDRVPEACKTASVTNAADVRGCNRYVPADLARPSTDFGCVGPPGPTQKIDRFWCPTTRKTALTGANGPPDYIGIYVQATHQNLTGLDWPSFTFSQDTVMRIEPRTLR
jgi:hypothetical protein